MTDLEKNKFVNDKFYSESKAKSMVRRGKSLNKIRGYLISKGIKDDLINDTVNKIKDENSESRFFSTSEICKKRK